MSRFDPALYSEPWMKNVIEDFKKRLDNPRRFQTDLMPSMWRDSLLGCSPKEGEVAQLSFTPGFIVTIKCGYRTLTYHTDNKQSFRLASDITEEPEEDQDQHTCGTGCGC